MSLACSATAPWRVLRGDTVTAGIGIRIDSALRVAERQGFSGVVRVERGGTVLVRKGCGLADRARRTPFTDATVFQIGSNTKDLRVRSIRTPDTRSSPR